MASPFHMVDDIIPENMLYEKYSLEFISKFWRNISLLLEESVLVMVSQRELEVA